MISAFHLDELQSLLHDFYEITQIRITVFNENLQELVSYPEQRAPFCRLVRASPEGAEACRHCDMAACTAAAGKTKTYIYRCHAGLTEAVMPLYIGDVQVGFLLFGHVFAYRSFEEGWSTIQKCCEALPVDMKKLKESCKDSPLISQDYIQSAARILHAVSSFLVLERMATLQADSFSSRLDAYLSEHFVEPITAQLLCQRLGIGRTYLYKLSQQLYGCGISQHVKKLRIDHAKQLLTDRRDLKISEIAMDCGFSDYNYFIAVFSRIVGKPPKAYRLAIQSGKSK